jgi:hypothetical protein
MSREEAIREALRRYGEKMLAEEQVRGLLPEERELLGRLK